MIYNSIIFPYHLQDQLSDAELIVDIFTVLLNSSYDQQTLRQWGSNCSSNLSLHITKSTSEIESNHIPKDYPLILVNDLDSLQNNKSSTVISIQSNSDLTHFKEMIDRRDFDCVTRLDINGIL